MTTPPVFQAGAGMVSLAYDFTSSGATFNPPAIIKFSYDPTLIPAGVAETSLKIAYYDNTVSGWITLTSTVDAASHFISTQITHFTPYAVTYGVKAVIPAPTTTTTTMVESTTLASTTLTTTTMVSTTPTLTTARAMTTTIEPPTTPNDLPVANIPKFRLSLLASAIGIAVFLITATTVLILMQRRNLLKNTVTVTSTGLRETTFKLGFENPQNTIEVEKQNQSPRKNALSVPEVIYSKKVPITEEKEQSFKSDFVKELETNLAIATTPWTDKLLGFQTTSWDSNHGEGEALMAIQGWELMQLYVDLGLANNIVWLSTEFGHRSRELDESYIKLCAAIADRLKRMMPSISMA